MSDDFANIVRSNKPHSVSVSERTGNATTAKNVVSSDADDHQSKKTVFVKQQQEEKINGPESGNKEDNIQAVNIENINNNNLKIATKSITHKNQGLDESSIVNNRQPITVQDPSLNIQNLPENNPLGVNRQAIDSGNFKDHLEILPSDKVVRNKVDFGSANKNITSSTQQTSSETLAMEPPSVSKSIHASPQVPQLTAQQAAKLKRDKSAEDFQGRVAAIRRNVKALNGKLDSFEPHV